MRPGDRVALKEDRQVRGTVIALLAHGGFAVRFDGKPDPTTGRMRRGQKFIYRAHHRDGFMAVTRET
jgi:hypothetical protein